MWRSIDSPDGLTPPPPPDLPPPSEQQILYRIDPLQSQAQYSVQEVYVGGIDGKLVVGQTSGGQTTLWSLDSAES